MRKNDERNPHPERDSGDKGSQNAALKFFRKAWKRAVNKFKDSIRLYLTKDGDAYHVCVSDVPTGIDRGKITLKACLERIITMGTLVEVTKYCYYVISRHISGVMHNSTFGKSKFLTDQFSQDSKLLLGESEFVSLNELNKSPELDLDIDLSEVEECALEEKMNFLLNQECEDGFTLMDRALLRMNQPLLELYGDYNWQPGELEKGKIVKYDPEEGLYTDP